MAFVKLFSSITESSLWSEPKDTRLLFVTMLAKADATGFVEASLPGLARVANLAIEETVTALKGLEGPDPHSKNPDHEGRRLVKMDGGWLIINYQIYRERRNDEDRQAYMREYMREYRAKGVNKRKQKLTSVSHGNPRLAHAEVDADVEGEVETASAAQAVAADPLEMDQMQASPRGEPNHVTRMLDKRTFADWRNAVARRIWWTRDEDELWKAIFTTEGWDEMTKGYNHLAKKHPAPKKIFINMFQELRG